MNAHLKYVGQITKGSRSDVKHHLNVAERCYKNADSSHNVCENLFRSQWRSKHFILLDLDMKYAPYLLSEMLRCRGKEEDRRAHVHAVGRLVISN